jgi:parvulin-like peptidyl-prolyl isomerase
MKKWKWLVGTGLVILITGGLMLWVAKSYDPLLFVVHDQAFRKSEWEQLKPKLMITADETDAQALERRSLEELVLFKGKQMNIQPDEELIEKQIQQLGATPEERNQKLAELNMTEEDTRNNYRRSMIGFEVKKRITAGLKVTEEEMQDYYNQYKELFWVPEYRTVRYLRAKTGDSMIRGVMKDATVENFPKLVESYTNDPNGHSGGWNELITLDHLAQHTSPKVAEIAFQSKKNELVGPIEDGEWTYWINVEDITVPYQQEYKDVRKKIHDILYQEKQTAQYREWLEQQKDIVGYSLYPENLTNSRWKAFWHDLPQNFRLLF